MVTAVMLIIFIAVNVQPFFILNDDVNGLVLSVDRNDMIVQYINDEGSCSGDLNVELDYLELNTTSVFMRWENIDSLVHVCGYDIDVVIKTDRSWLSNFTLVVNNKKILEKVDVIKPEVYGNTSDLVITMSEFRSIVVLEPAFKIIVIFLLRAI